MQSASDYLRSIATARALYRLLVKDALSMHPSDPKTKSLPLESHATIKELADKLKVSRSVVQKELVRLTNFGWVRGKRPRFIGAILDGEYVMCADAEAQSATGEQNLISHKVLYDILSKRETKTVAAPRRGAGRVWS